jgi:hypothetical protein
LILISHDDGRQNIGSRGNINLTGLLKRVFGFTRVRYRGLKNHEWLLAAFALVNLYLHRKRLVPLAA